MNKALEQTAQILAFLVALAIIFIASAAVFGLWLRLMLMFCGIL